MKPTSTPRMLARDSNIIPLGMEEPSRKWWVWSDVKCPAPYTTQSTANTHVLLNLLVRSEWPAEWKILYYIIHKLINNER